MSTTALCPTCRKPVEFSVLPAGKCPSCGVTLPDQLAAAFDATIREAPIRKPALLAVGMVGSALYTWLAVIVFVLELFNIGNYISKAKSLIGPELFDGADLMFFGGTAVLCGFVSYGLRRDRSWTRPFMIRCWVTVALGSFGLGDHRIVAYSILTSLLALVIAALYLYTKKDVTDYYNTVRDREEAQSYMYRE